MTFSMTILMRSIMSHHFAGVIVLHFTMLHVIILGIIMLNFCCAECHYTCHYAESHYAEHNSTQITPVTYVQNFFIRNLQTHIKVCNICSCSQGATIRAAHHRYITWVLHKRYSALNDIMPSVIMPSVIMPSVIMPSVPASISFYWRAYFITFVSSTF